MAPSPQIVATARRLNVVYQQAVRALVLVLAAFAGAGILAMMLVTCLDVVLRFLTSVAVLRRALYANGAVREVSKWLLAGEVDLVQLAGVISVACALPYTTAVKGHVAIEYFFHKLSRRGRIVVDTVARLLSMALFSVLSWRSVVYGLSLHRSGQVTATLEIPVFWVPYVIAAACAVVVLVILHNLLHPGSEMIRP